MGPSGPVGVLPRHVLPDARAMAVQPVTTQPPRRPTQRGPTGENRGSEDCDHEQKLLRHRRHPRHGRQEPDHARFHAAPGPRRRPGAAPRQPAPDGADRQGHAHLGLHARVLARGGLCLGRRRRAAQRPVAHAWRGLSHARAAAGPGRGHQRLAQPLRRQRHQVFLRRRREAARRLGGRGRGRARAGAAVGGLGHARQGQALDRCRRALHRVLQEHRAAQPLAARHEARRRRRARRGLPGGAEDLPRARRRRRADRRAARRPEHQPRRGRHRTRGAGAGGGRAWCRLRHRAGRRRRPAADGRRPGPALQR